MHDATSLVADLQDQLARHNKRIAFLFGAGTSCAVQVQSPEDPTNKVPLIPDVAGLTERCEQAISSDEPKFAEAWQSIWTSCKETGRKPNVEDVLTRVRLMVEAISSTDSLAGLSKSDLEKFEETMRREIARAVNPSTDDILDQLPHRQFARWLIKATRQQPVEVFTVNYDVLFELALEAERVPIFDGFVGSYEPFFHPDSLRHKEWAPGENYTRLWKMHGSVTWRKKNIEGRERVIRGSPDQSGEMILPSYRKYDESRQQPYIAFAERLTRFMELDDALLIVCGFAFGDQHINNLIFEALENNPRSHMYALQFTEENSETDLVDRSNRHHNVVVVGPNTGIIGGNRAKWGLPYDYSDTLGMFENTSNEQVSDDESDTLSSQMTPTKVKIVDFVRFCDFLAKITSN